MKRESRTVDRTRQADSATGQRHLPLVDLLVDTRAGLMERQTGPRHRATSRSQAHKIRDRHAAPDAGAGLEDADAREKQPDLQANTRSTAILKASLAQHTLSAAHQFADIKVSKGASFIYRESNSRFVIGAAADVQKTCLSLAARFGIVVLMVRT
jgi:hypothetical protein